MAKKDKREQVFNEEDKCVRLLGVWLIMLGEKLVGRITTRASATRGTSYITVHLYGFFGEKEGEKGAEPLYGYEKMTGWGYNRTDTGIGYIFSENRERLKNEYGIDLPDKDWEIQNRWQKCLTEAGYKVICAL